MKLQFSIIIPVYNRPEELSELLRSIADQDFSNEFEVLVVEDGSQLKSDKVVKLFEENFPIYYFYKENSGPGDSRNYGMQRAKGNYFIILDSDCILPNHYLSEVNAALTKYYTDAYGSADVSHSSFNTWQKAISYAMTSFLTTGGIRGSNKVKKFQPRSFNMGLSKEAFTATRGFSKMNYGEDIDLTLRLWEKGFTTQYIDRAYVYHKRRVTLKSYYSQVLNFGAARPILNKMHPLTAKMTYWFPFFFLIIILFSLVFCLLGNCILAFLLGIYLLLIFVDSLLKNKNFLVAVKSILTTLVMFLGYGSGFLRSQFRLRALGKSNVEAFPEMFV